MGASLLAVAKSESIFLSRVEGRGFHVEGEGSLQSARQRGVRGTVRGVRGMRGTQKIKKNLKNIFKNIKKI